MLNGNHPAHREAAAVARPIHLVNDCRLHIPTAQEVAVQGVSRTRLNGVRGSRKRLPQNLAAEDLRAADIAAFAAINIVLDAFELEEGYEVFEHRVQGQGLMSSRRPAHRRPRGRRWR